MNKILLYSITLFLIIGYTRPGESQSIKDKIKLQRQQEQSNEKTSSKSQNPNQKTPKIPQPKITDGHVVTYHPNGKIYRITHYKNDVLDGEMSLYGLNGELLAKRIFNNGRLLDLHGKPFTGTDIIKHPNGKIFTTIEFENGLLHGIYAKYDTEGQLLIKQKFEQGKIVDDLTPTQ